MSRPSEPVETTWMSSIFSPSPRRMIVPLPNCFSIWASAACRALDFSLSAAAIFVPLTWASMAILLVDQWVRWPDPAVSMHRLDAWPVL
jgi:hypothetical protein